MALTRLTGVLITRAQGQAMTSICRARISQPWPPQNGWPNNKGGKRATNRAAPATAGV